MSRQLSFDDIPAPKPIRLRSPDDLFETADESVLRRLGDEDRRFERKSSRIQPRQVGEYLCMWANMRPDGGLLALGMRDDGSFEGMLALGPSRINDLENAGPDFCPDAHVDTRRVAVRRDSDDESDFILLFRVRYHPTRVVRTSNGRAFARVGDRRRELTDDQVRQLREEKGEVHPERTEAALPYPEAFDTKSIRAFVDMVREDRSLSRGHSTESILEIMHLGRRSEGGFRPSLACALLFAHDPRALIPGCRIRFLRFDGEEEGTGERWNAVKDEVIDGTIPTLVHETARVLRSQLRAFSRLDRDGRFTPAVEYPEPAWYEAVVNACAHRSYGNGLSNMTIFVKMFDDRLVVESPGPFPPLVTEDNIYEVSNPRNPYLMDALRHLRFVKAAHEGTRRMRDTMREMGLPAPEFRQDEVAGTIVRVTLRNNIRQRRVWVDRDVAELIGARIAARLSSDEKRCLNHVAEHGSINVTQAHRLTGKSWETCKKMLVSLVGRGILEERRRTDIDRDPKACFVLPEEEGDPAPDSEE